jgi:hypothetical protein
MKDGQGQKLDRGCFSQQPGSSITYARVGRCDLRFTHADFALLWKKSKKSSSALTLI